MREHLGMFVDYALANKNINRMVNINVAKQGERVLRNVANTIQNFPFSINNIKKGKDKNP
jgi:hypothetical protein